MLNTTFLSYFLLGVSFSALLMGCGSRTTTPPEASESTGEDAENTVLIDSGTDSGEMGELEIRANGEDFVRQGFITKDGWQVDSDHIYVTLSEVTAYQSEPPFDANTKGTPKAETVVSIGEPITVDLAAGDDTAEPILVKTLEAPAGRYNALSWKVTPATTGPSGE